MVILVINGYFAFRMIFKLAVVSVTSEHLNIYADRGREIRLKKTLNLIPPKNCKMYTTHQCCEEFDALHLNLTI